MDNKLFACDTCEQCHFWKKVVQSHGPVTIGEIPRGLCFGMPPTPTIAQQGNQVGQMNLRPQTPAHEPACGMFVPSQSVQNFLDAQGEGAAN